MKTKEQKRREAYDRLVLQAQQYFRELCDCEQGLEDAHRQESLAKVGKNFPLVVRYNARVTSLTALKAIYLESARKASRAVWDMHHKFGYPLPENIHSFYNR